MHPMYSLFCQSLEKEFSKTQSLIFQLLFSTCQHPKVDFNTIEGMEQAGTESKLLFPCPFI